jgi:hypothetical protein
MILSEQEYLSYLKVHIELLFYCYCKMKGIKDGLSFEKFIRKPFNTKVEARNFFNEKPELLDSYLTENHKLTSIEKNILKGFKLKISSKFIILKQLSNYAIFMDVYSEIFYAVLALSDTFQDMVESLPVLVNATILPFNGKIIYDGFMTREVYIGKNMENNLLTQYKTAKENKTIIKEII